MVVFLPGGQWVKMNPSLGKDPFLKQNKFWPR